MADFFEKHKLNAAQREAVETIDGYIRLTAGAGSGKTRALVTRYIYLAEELGIDPDNILCITFTRKAADEMKKRIAESSSIQLEGSRISTYHGFCYGVIREDGTRLHLKKEFEIIDENEQEKIFRAIYEEKNLTLKDGELKSLNGALSLYKSNNDYIQWFEGLHSRSYQENLLAFDGELNRVLANPNFRMELDEITRFSSAISHYLARQVKNSQYDFNDLLNLTLHLFETDDYVRTKWQNRMQYIMVDEFQDSTPKEQMLLHYLSQYHKNLFVVGDPDQSIYSFKGGDINVFLDYLKSFPNVKDLYLNENYRSTKNIVDLSNELIEKNLNRLYKKSIAIRDLGKPVTHFHSKTDKQEMEFLVTEIKKIIDEGIYSWKNIAILLRTHRSKKPLEQALVKAGYPYNIADGIKFYARKEIKQAIAYIKMLKEDNDDAFLLTINTPKRRVGENLINLIKQVSDKELCSYYQALKYLANNQHPEYLKTQANEYIKTIDWLRTRKETQLSTLVNDLLRNSGYLLWLRQGVNENRVDNVDDLIDSIRLLENRKQQPVDLDEYLEMIDEFSRVAEEDEEKNEIQIMTIHSSKGLEFKVVFLPFFNDGVIPNAKSLSNIAYLEEERRLAYVAITRAEDLLYITESEGFSERGSTKKPSRFLFDFDRNQISEPKPINSKLIEQYTNLFKNNETVLKVNQNNDRNIGDIVNHKVFGRGIIISITDKNYEIKFDKYDSNRNISKQIELEIVANIDESKKIVSNNHISNEESYDLAPQDIEYNDANEVSKINTLALSSLANCENSQNDVVIEKENFKNSTFEKGSKSSSIVDYVSVSSEAMVEHPLWGIGSIINQTDSHYEIRFPEIDQVKSIPINSESLKYINRNFE